MVCPNPNKYFSVFYAKKPAVIPIVVGNDAAQTPSLFIYASLSSTTATGTAHAKHAVSPGMINYICDDIASSLTPLSIHI